MTAAAPDLKSALHRELRVLRQTLLWKLDGLSERDQRRPLTPTGTNLLGLLKHCALVEAGYLGDTFGRPWPEGFPWSSDDVTEDDNVDMFATEDESAADIIALAERVWAHTDTTLEQLDLDTTGTVPWWGERGERVTLGHIVVHLMLDLSRHAGHADILREQLDGSVGWRPSTDNLPPHDERWWAEYHARLDRIAQSRA